MKIIQKLKELMKRVEEAYEKLMKELMTRPVSRGAAPAPAALAAGMFGGAAPARVAGGKLRRMFRSMRNAVGWGTGEHTRD